MSTGTVKMPGARTVRADYGQWLARGWEHQQAGRPIDAMVCYRRALNSNAYAVQARYRLGEVLRDLGRDDEAREAWRAGLSLQPEHVRLQLSVAGYPQASIQLTLYTLSNRPETPFN